MYTIEELNEEALTVLKGVKEFFLPADITVNGICKYYVVCHNEQQLAVFDIRISPNAIKQMSIYYSKDLVMGETLSELDLLDKSEKALRVLVEIFKYVLPDGIKGVTSKIYANNIPEYTVFSIMARNLNEKEGYKVSLYSKWIDISIDGGAQ